MKGAGAGSRRRVKGAGAVLVMLAVLLGVAAASSPAAGAGSRPRVMSIGNLVLGPVAAGDCYQVTILATCTRKSDFVQINFTRAGHHYRLVHVYAETGRRASECSISRHLRAGSLRMRWGRAVRARLAITRSGPLHRTGRLGGCTGADHSRKVTLTGTLSISIHTHRFGRLVLHTVPGTASRLDFWVVSVSRRCRTGGSVGGAAGLIGIWVRHRKVLSVAGFVSPAGRRTVSITAPDNIGRRIFGTVEDDFTGGRRLFSFHSDLSQARIGGSAPFLTGGSRYTATDTCAQGQTEGVLRGKLVLHDPVSGRIRLYGSRAVLASLVRFNQRC